MLGQVARHREEEEEEEEEEEVVQWEAALDLGQGHPTALGLLVQEARRQDPLQRLPRQQQQQRLLRQAYRKTTASAFVTRLLPARTLFRCTPLGQT